MAEEFFAGMNVRSPKRRVLKAQTTMAIIRKIDAKLMRGQCAARGSQ